MKRQKYAKILIFIFTSAILQGCTTRTIRIDPIPELKIGSPLAGLEPLNFVIKEFEDMRPNKKLIGACRVGPKIELEDQKVSEIVVDAIANEIKRNGHNVLPSAETDKADVIIDGIVRGYWIQSNNYTFSIKITGMIETEIKVTTRQSKNRALSKTYQGDYYYETSGIISSGIWQHVINEALLDMVKELTTDEEFLSRLKQVRR